MLDPNLDDIDYENLDDLPLFDHVEWSADLSAAFSQDEQSFSDWNV